jgi:hypothetical protein
MSDSLSDEDLHAIASEYVRREYGPSFKAVPAQTYVVPDGIYFGVGPESFIGDGGFFVSRVNGEICPFGSGHAISKGIDYWLSRFAEGWRPGFYYLSLEAAGDRPDVSKHYDYDDRMKPALALIAGTFSARPMLYMPGVAFRVRLVPGGSMWTWAQLVDPNEFIVKLETATAVLLRAEILDALRSELVEGRLIGCRFTHLGEFREVELSESAFLERVHSAEEVNVATMGDFWVYLPTELERHIMNADGEMQRTR